MVRLLSAEPVDEGEKRIASTKSPPLTLTVVRQSSVSTGAAGSKLKSAERTSWQDISQKGEPAQCRAGKGEKRPVLIFLAS